MKKILFLILFTFLSVKTFTQDVNLFVKNVYESRYIDFSQSTIEITANILGMRIDDSSYIKIGKVTSAKDSEGNFLKMKKSYFGDKYSNYRDLKIKLEAPSRSSNKISFIKGFINILTPSKIKKSIIEVKNIESKFNTNLIKNSYADIKITPLNKQSFEKVSGNNEVEFNKKIKELKSKGVFGEAFAETLDSFRKIFTDYSFSSDKKINFYIDDPNKKLVEINVYNQDNKKISSGYSSVNNIKTISLIEDFNKDCYLEIIIENKISIKKYNFEIIDLILP